VGDDDDAAPGVDTSIATAVPACFGGTWYGFVGDAPLGGGLINGDPIYGSDPFWFYDVYTVDVLFLEFVDVELVSVDFDAWVEIYDSNCTLLAFDDDSLGGTDALASYFSFGFETLYIVASSFDSLGSGAYALDIY
jgi:hypothetical protein